jgi:hypothetical protein
MLFLLSVIAFLQMTFVPGFIVLKYSRITLESKLQAVVYTFAFSALMNYLLVYLLTVIKIYKPITIYIILLIEMLLLIYYRIRSGKTPGFRINFKAPFDFSRKLSNSTSPLYIVAFLLSIVVIIKLFYIFISQLDATFRLGDAVKGWNEFALDWFHNRLPVNTWFYPQLIPANWSLAYSIMRNPGIQAAARSIMPLFSILTAFLFLDLGLRKKNAIYLWGLIFYGIIIFYLYPPAYIVGGLMDIPVAFFAFLSFYVPHLHHAESPFPIKHAWLAVIFASTAAVTKQAGLYILIIILAWIFRLLFKNRTSLPGKTIIKTTAVILLIISVIVFSWYFYRLVSLHKGAGQSGIKIVSQNVHKNRPYVERLQFGFNKIIHAGGKKKNAAVYVYLALILLIFSLFPRNTRYVTLFVVIPFTLIWGLFFSYDFRNLTMAVPFMALSMAAGSQWFFKSLFRKWERLPGLRLSFWHLVCLLIPLLIILNFTLFKQDKLIDNQLAKQRLIGDVQFNNRLYRYYEKYGLKGKVFSKYPYFRHLPVLRDYWAPEREDQEVHYFIEDFKRSRQDIIREIKRKLKTGEYTLLFSHARYRFIKVK